MPEVTMAYVGVDNVQLNRVLQVSGPYRWSSKVHRLPRHVKFMTVLDSPARGKRHSSMLYSRLLWRYNLCNGYHSAAQRYLGCPIRPSWLRRHRQRNHLISQPTSNHP